MKARREFRCGRCQVTIRIGEATSREFVVPWHTACVIAYKKQRRALAASASQR